MEISCGIKTVSIKYVTKNTCFTIEKKNQRYQNQTLDKHRTNNNTH